MRVKAKERYMGKVFRQNCGCNATVVDYIDSEHVVVKFDDKAGSMRIVKSGALQRGKCLPKTSSEERQLLVGQSYPQQCGYTATIIEYVSSTCVVVSFDDTQKTKKTCTYDSVRKGKASPNTRKSGKDYIGQAFPQNCGYTATIIDYKGTNNVTVQFDDAKNSVRENCSISAIKAGSVRLAAYHKAGDYKGQSYPLRNGLTATVIEYQCANSIRIAFDDLEHTERMVSLGSLTSGMVSHPDLSHKNKRRNFYGYYVTSKPIRVDDEIFYFAKEIATGEEVFMTPYMMMDEYQKRKFRSANKG